MCFVLDRVPVTSGQSKTFSGYVQWPPDTWTDPCPSTLYLFNNYGDKSRIIINGEDIHIIYQHKSDIITYYVR